MTNKTYNLTNELLKINCNKLYGYGGIIGSNLNMNWKLFLYVNMNILKSSEVSVNIAAFAQLIAIKTFQYTQLYSLRIVDDFNERGCVHN